MGDLAILLGRVVYRGSVPNSGGDAMNRRTFLKIVVLGIATCALDHSPLRLVEAFEAKDYYVRETLPRGRW